MKRNYICFICFIFILSIYNIIQQLSIDKYNKIKEYHKYITKRYFYSRIGNAFIDVVRLNVFYLYKFRD